MYNITIDCHARISHKHRIDGKLGLQLSLLHYIHDWMGVTEEDLQVGIDVDVILENCTITFVILI